MMSQARDLSATEPTRVPEEARSREKFDAIVAEALRRIHDNGYEHTALREIARAAGMPIASVYQSFPNKLAQELPSELKDPIYQGLKALLVSMLSDAM